MARKARVKSTTGEYIIMLRGTEDTLFKSKKVKDLFLQLLINYLDSSLLGIRFFQDRAVIAVSESEKGISVDMKPVLISFARAYNRENSIDGKVFRDRFKSLPMDDAGFKSECMAYINKESEKDPFKYPQQNKREEKSPAKETSRTKPEKKEGAVKTFDEKPQKEEQKPQKRKNDMPTWLL